MHLLTAYQGKGDKNWVAKITSDFRFEYLKSEWTEHKSFIGWKKTLFEENKFYAFHTEKKTSYFQIRFDEMNEQINMISMSRHDVESILSEMADPFIEIKMQSIEFVKRSIGPFGVVWLKWCEADSMENVKIFENQTHYKIVGMINECTEQYTRNFQQRKDFGYKTININMLLHKKKSQYRLRDLNDHIIVNSLEDILENEVS